MPRPPPHRITHFPLAEPLRQSDLAVLRLIVRLALFQSIIHERLGDPLA